MSVTVIVEVLAALIALVVAALVVLIVIVILAVVVLVIVVVVVVVVVLIIVPQIFTNHADSHKLLQTPKLRETHAGFSRLAQIHTDFRSLTDALNLRFGADQQEARKMFTTIRLVFLLCLDRAW